MPDREQDDQQPVALAEYRKKKGERKDGWAAAVTGRASRRTSATAPTAPASQIREVPEEALLP